MHPPRSHLLQYWPQQQLGLEDWAVGADNMADNCRSVGRLCGQLWSYRDLGLKRRQAGSRT